MQVKVHYDYDRNRDSLVSIQVRNYDNFSETINEDIANDKDV